MSKPYSKDFFSRLPDQSCPAIGTGNSGMPSSGGPEARQHLLTELAKIKGLMPTPENSAPESSPLLAIVRLVPNLDLGQWQRLAATSSCEGWFALELEKQTELPDPLDENRRDGVTAMLTRPAFLKHAITELEQCTQKSIPLSIVVVELPGVDPHDPGYGGELLRLTSTRLWAATNHHDALGRLNGERMVLLLPESNQFHALALAESIVSDILHEARTHHIATCPLRAAVAASDGHTPFTAEYLLENACQTLSQIRLTPHTSVRDRVRLFRANPCPKERETLVEADEKHFLFFGGA